MFNIFGSIGWLIRFLLTIAFAGFWAFCSFTFQRNGADTVTTLGAMAVAVTAFGFALFMLVDDLGKVLANAPGADAVPETPRNELPNGEFDPDEIISRHLARKASAAPSPASAPAPGGQASMLRPGGFGRKPG